MSDKTETYMEVQWESRNVDWTRDLFVRNAWQIYRVKDGERKWLRSHVGFRWGARREAKRLLRRERRNARRAQIKDVVR